MTNDISVTSGTYTTGVVYVIWAITFALVFISVLELICELKGWPTISHRVEDWSDKNPWFSRGLITVLFVFLAHFFLNPLQKP